MKRRSFLGGLVGLFAAPAVVGAKNPVPPPATPVFGDGLRKGLAPGHVDNTTRALRHAERMCNPPLIELPGYDIFTDCAYLRYQRGAIHQVSRTYLKDGENLDSAIARLRAYHMKMGWV